MATLDFYKSDGSQVKVSLADDPANPGQYLPMSAGDLSLGTPGTGEPAHAGGSTGLIGWARDILAKIAAFGTSAAPSADVLSVQYPNTYVGKATLGALNAAFIVDTLGASQIAFQFPQGTGGGTTVQFEGTNSNATIPAWISVKSLYPTGPILVSGAFACGSGLVQVDTASFTQVRCRAVAYTSGPTEVLATRIYIPATNISMPTNTLGSPLFTVDSNATYYTDTTTPLAASATFTGSSRTMAAGNNFFNAIFSADTAGAGCQIQLSTDGTNWRAAAPGATLTANVAAPISCRRTTGFHRVVCSNSATPQTQLTITSSQTPV